MTHTKWANPVGKTVLTNLLTMGWPQTFNLLKKKKHKNKTTESAKCNQVKGNELGCACAFQDGLLHSKS